MEKGRKERAGRVEGGWEGGWTGGLRKRGREGWRNCGKEKNRGQNQKKVG